MSHSSDPHRGHRFPTEIISHAVWLYHVFSLSLSDVELLLAQRGVIVSYESIRRWCSNFGQAFADKLRRQREMAPRVKVGVDHGVCAQKPHGLLRRLEALHLTLSPPR